MTDRLDKRRAPVLNDENALKLGTFATNMRGGATMADIPGNALGTWEETLRLAQWSDRIGLDAVVPIARWRGYGGEANLGDRAFDTFTWAAGLLAATKRIQVFSTVHVPLYHPLIVAKAGATADHISGGRWGLNIVAGWNPEELAMFGLPMEEHDHRYEIADEWAQLLKQLWTTPGESDFDGRFLQVKNGFSEPKPLEDPWPVIMNAGTSGAGRQFAARHSDLIFAGLTGLDIAAQQVAEIKQLAREEHGRDIAVFGRGHIVCRDTEEEARRDWELIHHERADIAAAQNVVRLNMPNSQSADWESMKMQKILEGVIAGFWALPILGTPDQVTETILELHRAGLDGIALSWPDYDEGLQQMEELLLPRLVEAGVRRPAGELSPSEPVGATP